MIDLVLAPTLDPEVLDQPGAFGWWYVDLVDDQGDGIVLIWSFGLPFLPGLAGAARAGQAVTPRSRPSLNLSVYEGGRLAFYQLVEHAPEDVRWVPEAGSWRFGNTHIKRQRMRSAQGLEEISLTVHLDLEVPSSVHRLLGTIEVSGAACQGRGTLPEGAAHVWAPVTVAARGTASLRCGAWSFACQGRAYHDRNWGSRPLHELGIERWSWGRLALPGRELVWYQLQPKASGAEPRRMVIEVDEAGAVRSAEVVVEEVGGRGLSPFGLGWSKGLRFADLDGEPVEVEVVHKVDDGPFYQRFLVRGRCGEHEGWGVSEVVVPDRVDQPWMRPLVRMRVHRPGQANSMWLPLFSGPRRGRLARLMVQPLFNDRRQLGVR